MDRRIHSYNEDSVNFYNVDAHTRKASPKNADTTGNLVKYLSRALPAQSRELYLARALIVWIGHALPGCPYKARHDSPLGLVNQVKNRRAPASYVFNSLCGFAGIENVVIEGRAKAIKYHAGDPDSDYLRSRHSWNAFKSDGQWHLVHPEWATQAVIGYVQGDEILVEDSSGVPMFTAQSHVPGTLTYTKNDFWFCTNPEIFAARCLPNDIQWQQLADPIQNVQDFLSLPDLRQGFYLWKLSLLSEKRCVLNSDNGKCRITFGTPKGMLNRIDFLYELALVGNDVKGLRAGDMARLVLPWRDITLDTITFEIRFPVVGEYRFKVRVGDIGEKLQPNCAEFLLLCTEVDANCKKLPIDVGIAGLGCGPIAEEKGLSKPSRQGGKLVVKQDKDRKNKTKQTIVEFNIEDEACDENHYEAQLLQSGSDAVDDDQISLSFPDAADVVVDKKQGKLQVMASVHSAGEHALVIKAKPKAGGKAVTAVNYILDTKQDPSHRANEMRVKQAWQTERRSEKKWQKEEKKKDLQDHQNNLRKDIDNLSMQVSGKVAGKNS